jgi:hypothetical protein
MSLPNIDENILGTASTQAVHSTASRTDMPTLTTPSTVPPRLPKKKLPMPKSDSSALAYRRALLFLRWTLKSTPSCQHHRSGLITTPLERLPSVPTERPAPKRNSLPLCSASLQLKEDFLVRRNLSHRVSGVTTSSTPLLKTSVTRSLSQEPKSNSFAMLSQAVRPVLDLSQLNCASGPRRPWAGVAKTWREEQLQRAQDIQAEKRQRVINSRRQLSSGMSPSSP